MPVHNSEIAEAFEQIANLLEITGANPFRVRAYRNAARTVAGHPTELRRFVAGDDELTDLPGIGDDLSDKITEFVKTGKIGLLEQLKSELPPGLLELFKIEGLGPKKIKKLYDELAVDSLETLENLAETGEIADLEGFGPKTVENLQKNIRRMKRLDQRFLLNEIEQYAAPLVEQLRGLDGVDRVKIAGSFRRRQQTVGDLDILVNASKAEPVMEAFTGYEDMVDLVAVGDTKSSIILRGGLQVDLRVVDSQSWGSALLYFTGSKEHNVALRGMAGRQNKKINEYGIYQDDNRLGGATEKEIYQQLDLPYIEPELRENRGELEAARNDLLPELVELSDIKGDLQTHSTGSDGKNTLREMGEAARELGYQYLAVTDHSAYLAVTGGLDEEALKRQGEKIDKLNDGWDDFRLLKSAEVDILPDGNLSLDDQVLCQLDLVSVAIHSRFNLSEEAQTKRIIRALKNPLVDILVHPTGRLLGIREAYPLDMEKILQTALEENCFLEINASPMRLDLDEITARRAREIGLKLTISTDAHSCQELANMRYGIGQARRGWLRKQDVLNTRSWSDLTTKYLNS